MEVTRWFPPLRRVGPVWLTASVPGRVRTVHQDPMHVLRAGAEVSARPAARSGAAPGRSGRRARCRGEPGPAYAAPERTEPCNRRVPPNRLQDPPRRASRIRMQTGLHQVRCRIQLG